MKAILVLNEMPESCKKCVLKRHWFNYEGTMKVGCTLKGDCGIDYKRNERAVWCPLKPMPEKLNATEIAIQLGRYDVDDKLVYQVEGYNRCIERILGEQE